MSVVIRTVEYPTVHCDNCGAEEQYFYEGNPFYDTEHAQSIARRRGWSQYGNVHRCSACGPIPDKVTDNGDGTYTHTIAVQH